MNVPESPRRPKKVLHILAGAAGGAALSTIGLMSALAREGIASCAVCHSHSPSEPVKKELLEATRGDLLMTPLYWWNKKIRAALWKRPFIEGRQLLRTGGGAYSALKVLRFASRQGADLIHTSTLLTPEGGRVARWLGVPHVWHVRELVGPAQAFRFQRDVPALGAYLARFSSKVVANSQVTAAQLIPWLPTDLLEVVPNGIDCQRFRLRSHTSDQNPVVVAMVGDLDSRSKKHALFVESAALVDRSLPVEFRMYGTDPSQGGRAAGDAYTRDLHDRIRRHKLESRFSWPGFVPDPARIMSEIDVLVQPSDRESFGRVVVEAMASGVPVTGTRGGGCLEIVEDGVCGFLAEPDEPRELAIRIERLVKDAELRRSMGRAGRKRAEEKYSLESCKTGILRVYESAMEKPL